MSVAVRNRLSHSSIDVRVQDLVGQRWVDLSDLDPATPVAEILEESTTRLDLSWGVEWQARDRGTARLLRDDQTVGEFAVEGRVELTLQPDPRLG